MRMASAAPVTAPAARFDPEGGASLLQRIAAVDSGLTGLQLVGPADGARSDRQDAPLDDQGYVE